MSKVLVEIDSSEIFKILEGYKERLTPTIINPTLSIEDSLARNFNVGKLFAVEEIKAAFRDIVEVKSQSILEDGDM